MVGVAVKVVLTPLHIVVLAVAIVTLGVTLLFTVIVMALLVAVEEV